MEKAKKQPSTVGAGKKFVDLFCTYGLYFIFIVLIIFFAVQRPNFFSVSNFLLILKSSSVLGIAVVGMFFVLIVAGIDISVSMNMYFSAVIGATVLNSMELPLIVCFLAAGKWTFDRLYQWIFCGEGKNCSIYRNTGDVFSSKRTGLVFYESTDGISEQFRYDSCQCQSFWNFCIRIYFPWHCLDCTFCPYIYPVWTSTICLWK